MSRAALSSLASASKTLRQARAKRFVSDVDSVFFLIDRLNEFLAGVSAKTSTDLLDVQTAAAVSQVFLSLEQAWRAPSFLPPSDLDPAEQFLANFFHPLLDANSLIEQLESGSSNFVSERTFVQSMAEAYAPFLTRLESTLASTGFLQDQTDLILGAVIGTVLVCSFPLWVVYADFHGYTAVDRVVPRLSDSLSAAGFVLNDVRSKVLGNTASSMLADVDFVLSQLNMSLRQALLQKTGPYLDAFGKHAKLIFAGRTRPQESDVVTAVQSLSFWRHVTDGKTTISLAAQRMDAADKPLPYLGGIYFNATHAVQERSFLALPAGWAALEQAARFVSQAGFWLYVSAANNPYGGRHQPHNAHESGGDFDLGWTYVYDDQDLCHAKDMKSHKENLARMQRVNCARARVPNNAVITFTDALTNEDFCIDPISADAQKRPTHAAIQKLAAHVVLQAIALAGFKRYLYADAQNMRYAATNLGLAMSYLATQLGKDDPRLNPWGQGRGRMGKAIIPVTEAMVHYDHLHVELLAASTVSADWLLSEPALTFMYTLARERDNDDGFYSEMFQPRTHVERDESSDKIKAMKCDWKKRSDAKMPSLLPVWLTQSRWDQFWGL